MYSSKITRLINWAAMLFSLVLIAFVLLQIYQRHVLPQAISSNYTFDDLPAQHTAPVIADINKIINQHIFGVVPKAIVKKTAPKPKTVKPRPKSPLNIKLTGIIDDVSPERGMAMLEVQRGKTLVVGVGEKIGKTEAVLHQVLPGEILIDRGGEIESIKMVRKTLKTIILN